MYNVAIIGAGPAGIFAALEIMKLKYFIIRMKTFMELFCFHQIMDNILFLKVMKMVER